MIKLGTYNEILSWEDFEKVIDWNKQKNWFSNKPHKLDRDWLQSQIERMISSLKSAPNFEEYGSRVSAHEKARKLHILDEFTEAARELLTSRLPKTMGDFLSLCIEQMIDLPSTIHKYAGGTELFHKNGQNIPIIISRCNLGPEWIRHFMGVLYDKDFWEKSTRRKYNPFRNRDHHIHSILVAAIGQVILSMPVDERGIRAVEKELETDEGALESVDTVEELAAEIYSRKYSKLLRKMQPDDWIRQVWPAVAFWHDCGYDTATWCLLTFREFAHCTMLKNILKPPQIIWETLEELKTRIGSELSERMKLALDKDSTGDGYHDLWCIEEYGIEDASLRPWGRVHALFSASEFFERFQNDSYGQDNKDEISHLAVAIAEHHEPENEDAKNPQGLTDDVLAKRFVENPIRGILSFADALSGFARAEVRRLKVPPIKFGKIQFSINFNTEPLMMWKPKRGEETRIQFFRKGRWERKNMKQIRKSLWADFKENKRKVDN